ncbi:YciI family protein [Kutzneria viridogrisea]|uniref:YCII-related domain-containing protein n=1 Tax=Kutzneria viridogrisea TaxID=47990 RepID=A0ABR6BC54_9PSEU|nr:hypothetical protein [Kutzneria viridogrisea]
MPRFMTLIRIDEKNVPEGGPSPELHQRMDALFEEITKAGVMLETAGLRPTAEGVRVTWSGGQLSRTDGPFTESKEVIGGYSIVQAENMAEAIKWAERFLAVHEDYWTITAEVRQLAGE